MHGYHCIYAKDYYAGIDDAVKYGFDFVQFDLGVPQYFLDNISDCELTNIKNYAEANNVRISFHSPGDNVSLFSDYPLIQQGILDQFSLILEKANKLNAHHLTLHIGIYPAFKKHDDTICRFNVEHYQTILNENLNYLIERCGNVLLCVENHQLDSDSLAVLQKTDVYLTLDTAKMYKNYILDDNVYDFYVKHANRIRELHIHDMIKNHHSHQIVGSGMVDFNLFTQFVNDNVYINHEVRPVEAAKRSHEEFKKYITL